MDGIPVELFQIPKDDTVKVLHSICQHIWKTQQWPQDWKKSVFIPIPKKGDAKERSNFAQLHSSHLLAKWCSKFPKKGFNNTWTMNFQVFKLDFQKVEDPEIKLPISIGSLKKHEHSWKTSTSDSLIMPKPLTVWMTTSSGKFLKSWEYQTIYLPPEKSVCKSRSNS